MTTIDSNISHGRFCNQLIRSIATSLLAEKHHLQVSYAICDNLKLLGLNLFNGENSWASTIQLTDSNYFDILNLEKLESNLDPNSSYFQTKEIIQKVYDYIQSNKNSIILANRFKERYDSNKDCFVHIRLDDASQWNPGFEYYNKIIGQLKYDTLYISTDQLNHPLISKITSKYPAILIQYSEVNTLKFGSTCKYIVLSHGTFSSCIGYFSFFSDVYYPDFRNLKKWHGDIFSISGWNTVYYTTLTKDDIITTDKYLQAFPKNYFKTDTIVNNSSCWWRNALVNPPSKDLNLIISGHSDYGITDELVEYYTPRTWWTVNKQTNKVFGLPLGITNNTNESTIHPVYGNLEVMIDVMNAPKKDENLVYMNFNISTYPRDRQRVFNLFQNKEWVTKGIIKNTLEGRRNFLHEIRNHTFVLCPRGNGVDTHRLWETLYMGSIPIVKRDIALSDFEDLPICFIDSWEDITLEFLEKEKDRILSTSWNIDKLKISYWINKIKKSIAHQPRRKKIFNMDLHISVIEDFKNIFPDLDITHWCLSGHAWVFHRRTEYPKHINPSTWQNIDDHMIKQFQDEYDDFLSSFDGFICGHPNVFAMIFEKYNKPIIIINSCRYDIPFCWSKKNDIMNEYKKCLHRLKEKNLLIAVSNNLADQLYTKSGCDIETIHIPSLCKYTGMKYNPSKNTFLCYSGNIDHPVLITKKQELGHNYKWEELCKFKGIIHLPYEISTMSLFEQFTAGIPMFFPSKEFMLENVNIQSVKAYWNNDLPPNLEMFNNKSLWIENADFYHVFKSPNIYLFDSIPHLFELLETFEWKDDSESISNHIHAIESNWRELLNRVFTE